MDFSERLAKTSGDNIRLASLSDLRAIARVHTSAFQGFFLTELGDQFLRAYYRTVLRHKGGILLVAEKDGLVSGFAAGFVDPVAFYRKMARRKWRFVLPVVVGLLRNPRLLRRVLGGSQRVIRPEVPASWPSELACELSSIAVDPQRSRQGIGGQLLTSFLKCAASSGATCVFLTTDAENNDRVIRFYDKYGFRVNATLNIAGQRSMNQYVIELQQTERPCEAITG